MYQAIIPVSDHEILLPLFGPRDRNVRLIRESLDVSILARDGEIRVEGPEDNVAQATAVIEQLKRQLSRRGALEPDDVAQAMARVTGDLRDAADVPAIEVMQAGREVRPRTLGQARYVEAISKHDLTFVVGPAGTGKTYLAVAMAVAALKKEKIRKIVLVRPAVEAGESLGFLPGDLAAKINPYLRPLLDALHEMIDYEQFRRYMEQDVIEVIPLAYMRGRTLNEAFIILDEAQNTTVAQMKMFLTRMGAMSKIVVAGDTTQIDLPAHQANGLIDAVHRLESIEGFARVELGETDIVRHRLVQDIVRAYEDRPGAKPAKSRRR
ncbi:MAG: PhoH family protein [Planctomycetota bacterium]|nr:MAG: PhoH family protein [Planctomycetota bacterium]REJ87110.1 MAG: PhoH family protein [Planctomycetota bacterium]REK26972.1 MAG: PhoH family protein [Planctomycetota bacterium]REK47301.1 MAG: PhoH family protein [Planctomycetota bacterium]